MSKSDVLAAGIKVIGALLIVNTLSKVPGAFASVQLWYTSAYGISVRDLRSLNAASLILALATGIILIWCSGRLAEALSPPEHGTPAELQARTLLSDTAVRLTGLTILLLGLPSVAGALLLSLTHRETSFAGAHGLADQLLDLCGQLLIAAAGAAMMVAGTGKRMSEGDPGDNNATA